MPARFQKPTYTATLDELPPYLVINILARKGRRAMTQEEIAAATGFSVAKIAATAKLKSWATVTVGDADKIRIACGVTRNAERRARWYVKRSMNESVNGFQHLRRSGRRPKFLKELGV